MEKFFESFNPIPGLRVHGRALFVYFIASILTVFVMLKWLAKLNNILEVIESDRIGLKIAISVIIPLYGIILSFSSRQKLLDDPNREIKYGRLRIV